MKDKKETFKDLKCSPSNDDNTEFSCYSANELNKIKGTVDGNTGMLHVLRGIYHIRIEYPDDK